MTIETDTGEALDRHAWQLGIKRKLESDAELRARLRDGIAGGMVATGSFAYYDYHLENTLRDVAPVAVIASDIKPLVAIHWLRASRPVAFFARLRWYWRTWRAIWGKR